MDTPALWERIAKDSSLFTPPGLALRIFERAGRPDCRFRDIAELISLDSSLCGRILRTANSDFFALKERANTVDQALILLGNQGIRSVVVSLTLPALQRQLKNISVIEDYARLAISGGVIAREIALRMERTGPEDHFVAGLLRDLGMLILHQVVPGDYTTILDNPPEVLASRQCELEEERLGIHHAEVSAWALSHWHMPSEIIEAVRFHHHSEKLAPQDLQINLRAEDLAFASLVAYLQLPTSQPVILGEVLRLAQENYGMDRGAVEVFLETLDQKIREFVGMINIEIGAAQKYRSLVAGLNDPQAKETLDMNAVAYLQNGNRNREESETTPELHLQPAGAKPDFNRTGANSLVTQCPYTAAPSLLYDLPPGFLTPPRGSRHLGILGPYEIHEILGRGGMGLVLKGHDVSLNRLVAIKVLAPALAAISEARRRFAREVRAAAAVRHERVVAFYNVNESAGLPYMVMEFVSGRTLQDILEEAGSVDFKLLFQVAIQVCEGLQAAHSCGLIHRDIKPGNIMLTHGEPRVKITDFGLARAIDDVSITKNGIVMGTPHYMAPEQACGQELDHRADLFSLGSVLYTLATGLPPFDGLSMGAVMRCVVEEKPRPIRELRPKIPIWFAAIIEKLHAKNPDDRFQHASEIMGALLQHAKPLEPVSNADFALPV